MKTLSLLRKPLSLLLMTIAVTMFAISPAVQAAALVTVIPYDNLSVTSPTTVTVNASGLLPNTEVSIRQVEMNRVETGVAVEQKGLATAETDINGAFSKQVNVQYDVRTDLAFADFCQNSTELGRLCYLELRYSGGESSGEVIVQHKLYFGVAAPAPETPTPTSPASKDDCKSGGWQNYVDANGQPFKSQGACVSSLTKK
jgi:hypothetical protein